MSGRSNRRTWAAEREPAEFRELMVRRVDMMPQRWRVAVARRKG